MPKVGLEVKAALENVKSFTLIEPYVFCIRQSGGTEERQNVEVDSSTYQELLGSKGIAHFKVKWDKKDKSEAYATLLLRGEYKNKGKGGGDWQQLAVFEVRGLDLIEWKPTEALVESISGMQFNNADLSDPDGFSDYDDKQDLPVAITDIQYRFKLI